jgi:copper(I)-binding protein
VRQGVAGLAAAGLLLGACGADDRGLLAEDVTVLAPLPGQEAVVAYLTLVNAGPVPVEVTGVTSPEFARVEMHTTVSADGVAEMLTIDSLTVAPESAVDFATGERHLMLTEPRVPLAPGDDVTLEFHYGADDSLTVSAPLEPRLTAD